MNEKIKPIKRVCEDRREEANGKIFYNNVLFCGKCEKRFLSSDFNFCPYCGTGVEK